MKKSKKITKNSLYRSANRNYPVITKNILIQFDQFSEIIQNFNVGECVTQSKQLNIHKLLRKLQKHANYFFKDKIIRYFLYEGNLWLACPHKNFCIDQEDFMPFQVLKVEAFTNTNLINVVMKQEEASDDQDEMENDDDDNDHDGRCRRLKQRKIKHVIEKVLKWRELYAGIQNGVQTEQKIPLDQGALMVKISKKTLDDYLSQLKKGKRYGFNFNEHKNQKIGVLREFIRKKQRKNK